MELLRVGVNEIKQLSEFASEVFVTYYDGLIGHEQATYMADLFLSEKAISGLLEQGAVFKLLKEEDRLLGFTEYMIDGDRIFLSKLYVDQEERSRGYGRILFKDCKRYASEHGLHKIYLTVNKYNTPSYEIYLHLGFTVIDAVVNDIGHGYVMDDYIMEYEF